MESIEPKSLCILLMVSAIFCSSTSANDESFSALETTHRSTHPDLRTGTATDVDSNGAKSQENSSSAEQISSESDEDFPSAFTSWSEWSTCSSTLFVGFQIRNRICPEGVECVGDDVQLHRCNQQGNSRKAHDEYSRKYVEKCKSMENAMSLSCKLYIENPGLAYDIYLQNSCFFTVNNDENGNGTSPIPEHIQVVGESSTGRNVNAIPDSIDEILSVNSEKGDSFKSKNLKSTGSKRSLETREEENYDEYRRRVIQTLVEKRKCKVRCKNTMNQAARLWALGTSFARSVQSTINILHRNDKLSDGIGVMFFEYNACISRCLSLRKTNDALTGRIGEEAPTDSDSGSNILDLLQSLQQEAPRDRNRQNNAKSLCGSIFPACADIAKSASTAKPRSRGKRQLRQEYESPCYSSEDIETDENIKLKAGAELFFYESYVQRFAFRKCGGTKWRADLFHPKEVVTQNRNNKRAFCRQGFLKRYALIIVADPEGEHVIESTGEKFKIEWRNFDVESHCEIVISK